jgi:uncharacterized membrane protein
MLIFENMKGLIKWIRANPDILVVLAIGIFMRARIITRDELWYDEAFTGNLMRVPLQEFWSILGGDPHPPLYYLLLRGWTWITGVSDLSLRSFSLIFGVLSIYLVYLLVKDLFKKETAVIASFLVAVSPFLVDYSVEARSYSLYGFFAILATLLLVSKKFNLFAVTLPFLILTHYFSFLFLPPLLMYYGWIVYKHKLNWYRHAVRLTPALVVGVFVLYMSVGKGLGELDLDWIRGGSLANIPNSITAYSYGVKSRLAGEDQINNVNFLFDENLLGIGIVTLYFIGAIIVFYKNRTNLPELSKFLFIFAMSFLPMLIVIAISWYTGRSMYVERYLLPASFFFLISWAFVMTDLLSFEIMGITLLFYVFTLTRIMVPGYYSGMKPMDDYFNDYRGEIVFTSPIDYVVGKYYLTGREVRLLDPQDPESRFEWWPFVYGDTYPQDINTALFISPDPYRMTDGFEQPMQDLVFGNYEVYVTNE